MAINGGLGGGIPGVAAPAAPKEDKCKKDSCKKANKKDGDKSKAAKAELHATEHSVHKAIQRLEEK